ncbi:putative membrane protein [Filimonas zeae]|uniref:Heparan-alpha-glucosaminide N-acetyltransferase catalytic domain-containing protein n=1 Tax=Filimonas zeae TaxID=1737353 RepID=A0A917IRE2_9BACT|nr:heparan-alpha-glucosaminide N-acetyltransferase domain-containing protein [Filimonas zeae]MDR6337786.1 putative membrane protein [Filimonas zeae]GGH60256.1 hypothetical protein GCM10011379_07910 [Filimonas zeae]
MQVQPKQRIQSIDVLRGIVMIIMALDHVRDFFSNARFDPTDLSQTTIPYFFTRFITHYCAPVFVFLSGISAFLGLSKGKTKRQQSAFLLTRGLWLIVAEVLLVNPGFSFNWEFYFVVGQVIWAIGWSMIVLACLIYVKPVYAGLLGIIMITGHNALDGIHAADWGSGGWLWNILHETGVFKLPDGRKVLTLYPLVPWIGVMSLGYWSGQLYKMEADTRVKILKYAGVGALILFVVLRFINLYGDLHPREVYVENWKNILSFINVTKYPPSLDYLLVTLGPACLVLAAMDGVQVGERHPALVFGRVPFFYYLLHLYLAHGLAVLTGLLLGMKSADEWTGYSLPVVYGVWGLVVVLLYFPCRWYMGVKARRRDWWLSYL